MASQSSHNPSSAPPSFSSSSSSSSSSFSSFQFFGGGARVMISVASSISGRLLRAAVTFAFAIVGMLVGAVAGALIGAAKEHGLFRGAGIGAISGAVFSIEAADSSFSLWRSSGDVDSGAGGGPSASTTFRYVAIDIIAGLWSGRLVEEKVGPAIHSAVLSQMNDAAAAAELTFIEGGGAGAATFDLFDTAVPGSISSGMAMDSVERLPKVEITMEAGIVDAAGEPIPCSVCLQELEVGETARRLPGCRHLFHMCCIDSWLVRHGTCPLCRRDISAAAMLVRRLHQEEEEDASSR